MTIRLDCPCGHWIVVTNHDDEKATPVQERLDKWEKGHLDHEKSWLE